MPKMSSVGRAISMTRSNTWNSTTYKTNSESFADFCLNRRPHPNNPCKGDCPEMKEFRKNQYKRSK